MQTSTENIAVNKVDNFAANVVDNIVINSATRVTVVNSTSGAKKKRKKRTEIRDEDATEWVRRFDEDDDTFTDISKDYSVLPHVVAYNVYKYKNLVLQDKLSELQAKLDACCKTKKLLLDRIKVLEESAKKSKV